MGHSQEGGIIVLSPPLAETSGRRFAGGRLHVWWVHQVLQGRGWDPHKLLHLGVCECVSACACGQKRERMCVDVGVGMVCGWVRSMRKP